MNASVLVFYLSICLSYVMIRPLATLVHESGHLAYLLLTGQKGEIKVFLGSLGEGKGAWRIRTGRILWVVHPSGMLMRGSLTDFQNPLHHHQLIPYAVSGPVLSALMALLAASLAFGGWTENLGDWTKPFLVLAALIPTMDFFLSLFYTYSPILHGSETVFGNDGELIAWRIRYKKATPTYLHGWWLFEKERYAAAAECFAQVRENDCKGSAAKRSGKELMEHMIFCAMALGQPAQVLSLHAQMAQWHPTDPFDECHLAFALAQTGNREGAWAVLNTTLRKAPGHHEALNQRACMAIQEGKLELAAKDLDKAIQSNQKFALAHCNRASLHLLHSEAAKALPDL
ncbi:MAG TPA: hypothetical protein VHS96_13190, partial [Bacteroidia bacterium]|nr:hypothetical protein [Bacteroidia bacterium]